MWSSKFFTLSLAAHFTKKVKVNQGFEFFSVCFHHLIYMILSNFARINIPVVTTFVELIFSEQ